MIEARGWDARMAVPALVMSTSSAAGTIQEQVTGGLSPRKKVDEP
jgi:hypothetical protein